jgi:hypothetical protein
MQTTELDTYKEQGIEKKEWEISDAETCDDCEANNEDGEIGVDESFSSGDDAPPLHPNCRCFLQAVPIE